MFTMDWFFHNVADPQIWSDACDGAAFSLSVIAEAVPPVGRRDKLANASTSLAHVGRRL
jgi:hypothetical protein